MSDPHHAFLQMAIDIAAQSVAQGGFPAGAVIVKDGTVLSTGVSIGNILHDPTSHGEIAAIRAACAKVSASDLSGATLYTSMQPCLMCFSAAMWGGIKTIFYAARKTRVDAAYYGSTMALDTANESLLSPITAVHIPELEDASLRIVHAWEASQKE